MGILDPPGITKNVADRLYDTPPRADNLILARDPDRINISTDTATVDPDAAADGTTFNRAYVRGAGAEPPSFWPVYTGRNTEFAVGGASIQYQPGYYGYRKCEVMADRDRVCFYVYVDREYQGFQIEVDGAPLSATQWTWTTTGLKYIEVVFTSHKTRRIGLCSDVGLGAVYTQKPGKLWKPDPYTGPVIGVMGDSYTSPTVYDDAGFLVLFGGTYGAYQTLAPRLGVEEVLVDAIGGTGYLKPNGSLPNYLDRWNGVHATYKGLKPFNPDVVVVHGGGANDLKNGYAEADIADQAIELFTTMRADLPDAKLVYNEGFAPPSFTPTFYNPLYVSIRTTVQAALTDVGVYYIPVASDPSGPWLTGAGNAFAPDVDGENADIYVGADSTHLTIAGNTFMGDRMAVKLRTILRDRGELLNQLV